MHPHTLLIYALLLAGLGTMEATVSRKSRGVNLALDGRATGVTSCTAYGAGFVNCGKNGCYNPSAGESCCSDGSQ